ncbi:hypothetical protein [Exilibacterium tricleocarpae]|nr:hypothetical protein [Exilibacterium tricleocarpae]
MALVYYAHFSELGWTLAQYIVAALLAFDIIAGVATNATTSAKRWYHRPSQKWHQHMGFVVLHGLHVFLVAWLFRDMDISFFIVIYLLLLLSSAAVVTVSQRVQRSVALLLVCNALLISQYLLLPTPGFEWFIPFLFLKLLVSHLTLEEPYL